MGRSQKPTGLRRKLKKNRFSLIGLGVFVVVFAGIGGYLLLQSHATGPMANLWVDGGSGSCTRSSTPAAYNASTACANGPQAYAAASLGDTIYTQGNLTVTSQWNFTKTITKTVPAGTCDYNYGGASNLSNCVTIEPAPGQSLTFNVAGNNLAQVTVCVSGLSIQNAIFNMTTYTDQYGDTVSNTSLNTGAGDNTCGTSSTPHDDYYADNSYGGQASIVGGVSDVYMVGGTATAADDFVWQFGGFANNGTLGPVSSSGVIGITFEGYNFANTDSAHHHMACMHENGALDSGYIADNQWQDCPVSGLEMETLNSTSNIT